MDSKLRQSVEDELAQIEREARAERDEADKYGSMREADARADDYRQALKIIERIRKVMQ